METESRNSLCDLPDAIIHHILSLLEVKDIARLRGLCRRFQTLCISTPTFSFPNPRYRSVIPDKNCSCVHAFKFMNSIPRQRPHDLKIDRLSFSSSCTKPKHRKLHKQWLNKLFQTFRVDEFSLHYDLHSIFTSLPRFQCLKVLKLINGSPVPLKLPQMKLASLERLHMGRLETQDSVGAWVSQSFPSLKSLVLTGLQMLSAKQLDLTIQISSLEDLAIDCCCTFIPVRIITHNLLSLSYTNCYGPECCHRKSRDEVMVDVSAPNLQYFAWVGALERLCYDKNTFKNLHVATITYTRFHDLNLAKQFFEAIHSTRILCVDSPALENLYENRLISFAYVLHLEIRVEQGFFEDNVCDILTTSLERLSNLQTLTLAPHDCNEEAPYYPFSFMHALRECGKIKWKTIKGLKKVKFIIGNMYYKMAFLIGLLKKYCVDMEEMTLSYPPCYHRSIKLYLDCFKSASSTLSINLSIPYRKRCRSHFKKPSRTCCRDEDNQTDHAKNIMSSSAERDIAAGFFGSSSKKLRQI